MAAKGLEMDRQTFVCSICLDLLKEPVTIQCGHSYCMNCLNTHWNEEAGKKSYSCPQCRQKFPQRPVLVKNSMLSVLMEGLKKTGLPAAPADHIYAALGDVSCDLCSGRKLKAVKSCLQCLVSYCKDHLQPHYDVAASKRHKLVEPTDNLQDNICSEHQEAMKMFCCTDQQCICYLCSVDQHKGHDIVTTASKRKTLQDELEDTKQKICKEIKEKQKPQEMLKEQDNDLILSASKAIAAADCMFDHVTSMVKNRVSKVEHQIKFTQERVNQLSIELQDQLQKQMDGLKRKHLELEKLVYTEDHCAVLQNTLSQDTDEDSEDESMNMKIPQLPFFGHMIQRTLKELTNIHVPVPRNELLQYARDLTFDPKTAHSSFALSDGNRKIATALPRKMRKPHPVRFDHYQQVLSKEALTGRCYIEIQVNFYWDPKVRQALEVALSYKGIQRKGDSRECEFGGNDQSWSLSCYRGEKYLFSHKNVLRKLHTEIKLTRMGIYLDHDVGLVCFYRLNEPQCLIYETMETFTKPLHLGIAFNGQLKSLEICKIT